ncbi:hypothetical protein [Hydrogenivirga sp. 128-5-R1-1]|uniref:hypothetical protein n=1 Tax=Hydrogenivirga sp. 128-5-R1-1 TaxID=392423 RepID=UPI00015F33AD|nr:hypothetical protein [Hydrogenivirga sp. 128-5-R1-1]EDP74810.1 hypothetical protein HG1285_13117 [Hydrogenivirga sp. 128-5-R1-1]
MRSTGDALGFGAASQRLGLTPHQTAERLAYLSTQSNMGTMEGLQNFANRYFGGDVTAAREFMSYMNESGALSRWRALANVARQTGIAPKNASDREAGMAMFNYLQSASVKGQYGDSYRLNNLLADLSNQTGLSQTEILRRMAGAQGFTFTDKDGSVKTMKFDGNGNAVIARSEKGISAPVSLGGGVVMQSGVVKTEGVGDNMVTTYSGVFSYTGRDGKQHTLEGSVTTDSKGNVVSIQGAGGVQVSDAVKEDFMNALSRGNRTTYDDSYTVQTGMNTGDTSNAVQLLSGIARRQIPPEVARQLMNNLANDKNFREAFINQLSTYATIYGDKQYTRTTSVGESAKGEVGGGTGFKAPFGLVKFSGKTGKSWQSGESDGAMYTYSQAKQRVAKIVNDAVRMYRGGADAQIAIGYIDDQLNTILQDRKGEASQQAVKVEQNESRPHMHNVGDKVKQDATEMDELGRKQMGETWPKGSEQFGGKREPPAP